MVKPSSYYLACESLQHESSLQKQDAVVPPLDHALRADKL